MTITAAADGSALGNPGPNGWAWYIDDDNWGAGGSAHGTNNQGELQAVLELLKATAGSDDKLHIRCDSRYVIDSVTKWMPGWKRRGWRKSDGGPVLNRDLLEGIDEAMRGRDVQFSWVKGHAGDDLNEAADQRANAAATAYKNKQEPKRGPGFTRGADATAPAPASAPASGSASAPDAASAPASGSASASASASGSTVASVPTSASPSTPTAAAPAAPAAKERTSTPRPAQLWADPSDLLDGLDAAASDEKVELRITVSGAELARLRDAAEAQGVPLEEALRRLI